jgi:kojibiose phosphorylase
MSLDPLWTIREEAFEPVKLHHKETIFTSGNGYLSMRGTFEEGYPGDRYATLVHGVFDDVPVVFTELVNVPSWFALGIRIAGERFSLASGKILRYRRWLRLNDSLLIRSVRWRSPTGRTVDLRFERFASLADPHVLCQRVAVTPVNFSGELQVQMGLDGRQDTLGFRHWVWIDQAIQESSAWLHIRTRETKIELAIAMRMGMHGGQDFQQAGWDVEDHPTLSASWQAAPGETAVLEKIVCLYTSRDVEDPPRAAREKLANLAGIRWEALAQANRAAWEAEWERSDVILEGDDDAQLALRFNLYQLLIAAPRQDARVSIGAKTLSGFGYRGHVFWDTEIFMLPFFIYTRPEIARNLLSYRCHTLPGARRKAQKNGFPGAQYAWESAATGDEVTPVWVPDFNDPQALVRIWCGDIEIHVSADVAHAIRKYWLITGDDEFMLACGLEIILETARFWASRAEWIGEKGRYEFTDVIGPDEYHDHVDNNAYTNYLARWHLIKAADLVSWAAENYPGQLKELTMRIGLGDEEPDRWRQVAGKIHLPFSAESQLIEQFDGYFRRRDVNLAEYSQRTQSMQVILGIEGASQTQVIKQPDVLMLLYLLPKMFDEQTFRANYEYYSARTDHTYGSSLGPAIQAIMACKVGRVEEAYEHFLRSAHADLYDVRGNAGDGIHGASAGGLWQAIVFGFAGLEFNKAGWALNPRFPEHWRRLAFKFYYRGEQHGVEIRRGDTGYEIRTSQRDSV